MTNETLPAKRLENALGKLQEAQSALKMAADELAIVDAEMIGSDAHRGPRGNDMSCQHNLRWCHGSDLLQCAKCGYHCNQDSVTGMIIDLAMTCNNAKSHADACAARETLSAEMRAFQEAEQAKAQDAQIQRMNRELQERAKENTNGNANT